MIGAAAVATSRVYLSYHTPKQILVGITAGTIFAVVYFLFTASLRRFGWIDWALDTRLARMIRLRDLITTEDLQDAGWGRFEAQRKARQESATISRKSK
jgi:dolichyldiphosphatase